MILIAVCIILIILIIIMAVTGALFAIAPLILSWLILTMLPLALKTTPLRFIPELFWNSKVTLFLWRATSWYLLGVGFDKLSLVESTTSDWMWIGYFVSLVLIVAPFHGLNGKQKVTTQAPQNQSAGELIVKE